MVIHPRPKYTDDGECFRMVPNEQYQALVKQNDAMRKALEAVKQLVYCADVEERYLGNMPSLPASDRIKILHLCWDALALSEKGPS